MDLSTTPDIYSPSIDSQGNYIDKIPSFNIYNHGLYCPCGSRKEKIYESKSKFSQHIKTQFHNKWLENLNLNKANYYIESLQHKLTISNQKLIIAKMEVELQNKNTTISNLTNSINDKNLIDLN